MHVYIINWRVVHRQYLCNTYCLHIISLLVETSVPLVHETMDTVSEGSLGLRAEPFFNGFSDLIVVCEPASLQCFFSGPNTWKSQGDRSGLYGGWWRTSHRKCCIRSLQTFATWGWALSCDRITPFDNRPRLQFLMAVFSLRKISQNLFALTVPPVSNHSNIKGPFLPKKTHEHHFPCSNWRTSFFLGEELECCHSILICFVAGLKKWHQVSLQATIRDRKLFPSVW